MVKKQASGKLHLNADKGKKRKNSSHIWITRHINDTYVQNSKKDGYRSRASYKLLEINEKFSLIKQGNFVLDLGASPGSWSQIAVKLSNSSNKQKRVLAVDLLQILPMDGLEVICGDIYDEEVTKSIMNFSTSFNVVLSDIAPNTTGQQKIDHLRIIDIAENILLILNDILAENGHFVVKIFQGSDMQNFINDLRKVFKSVKLFKPESSRKESPELYVIAQNFIK